MESNNVSRQSSEIGKTLQRVIRELKWVRKNLPTSAVGLAQRRHLSVLIQDLEAEKGNLARLREHPARFKIRIRELIRWTYLVMSIVLGW